MNRKMQSYRLTNKTIDQIEWLKEYLSNRDEDNYTATDIIGIAIQEYVWMLEKEN